MCGICGVVSSNPAERIDPAVVVGMREMVSHRGPDDCGLYVGNGVGLGHRRLSIIDLRPEGRQPMSNEDGSVQIVFNGEIYNFAEHRDRLIDRGHRFRSRSDTEVIIHLYEELGVQCLERLRGMFALAIWDERKRMLVLARDRLGKKPLFYHFDGERLIFGSEPKAILAYPGVEADPDPEAIDHYLTLGFVPSPWSAFKGLKKLPPAHYLTFADGRCNVECYWRLHYLPKLKIDEEEASEEIVRRLTEAVKIRMVSDVPLGAFLSGGLDSSAIVALMSELSERPVKTFSIGFNESDYDETAYARLVAQQFGTDHYEFRVEPNALEVIDKLVWHYNEPYADSSSIATYYLAKMAREHVTVVLNGDAGDENFAGYRRHSVALLAGYLRRYPASFRRVAGDLIKRGYQKFGSNRRVGDRMRLLASVLAADPSSGYAAITTHFDQEAKTNLLSREFLAQVRGVQSKELGALAFANSGTEDTLDSALYADTILNLPDDLLVKVDIASMAVALEARSPMLDHEFMEFVARLPSWFKARGFGRKIILKRAFRSRLPKEIVQRSKMGFGVPLEHWFRGELMGFLQETLLSPRSLSRGYFNPNYIARMLDEHRRGVRTWHTQLWTLAMLELWHRAFIDRSPESRRVDQEVRAFA